MIPFLDLEAQHADVGPEILSRIEDIMYSGQFVLGPYVEAFESDFARFSGVDYCIGVSSGTSALQLALLALDIGPGDEVITVSQTFVATVAAIQYIGATPVLVDVDPARQTMCPDALSKAITPSTKAIIPVHLFGQPAAMREICEISESAGIKVIADAAQAHGAFIDEIPIANWGDIATFSFYPGKNLGACGEAGAVVTGNAEIADRIKIMRDWGQTSKNYHELPGFNYRMDAIQGAALGVKLTRLKDWIIARSCKARLYDQLIVDAGLCDELEMPLRVDGSASVNHLYVIRTSKRDQVRSFLNDANIQTGVHYPLPVHLSPAFSSLGYDLGSLPESEKNASRVLSLPLYPELPNNSIVTVVETLKGAYANEIR